MWKLIGGSSWVRGEIGRQKKMIEVLIEAERVAYNSLDDSKVKTMLAERLGGDHSSIDGALTVLARRIEYISDRARRLLLAVGSNSPVAPMPQEWSDLFTREEALGRMPLKDAFCRLAESEPRLADLGQEVECREITGDDRASRLPSNVNKTLAGLVGADASVDDVLLRTNLAASIVRQYLEIESGITILGEVDTSYFDAPLKIGVKANKA